MRHRILSVALAVGIAAALGGCAATYYDESPEPYGYDDADYGYFYDALSPYGAWYDVAPYGWVWTPYDVPIGWRPYTDGHWVYTAWGWTWLSDDPWGWAPYHYGRWTYDQFYGWIWVPGNVWGPAWVAWRYGDGWVGWAPLPPQVRWSFGVGLDYGTYDFDRDFSHYRWSFCRESDFTTTRVRTVVLPRSKNVTLLRTTRNVTRYEVVDGRPAERGFDASILERDLRRKIPRYDLADAPAVGRNRPAVIRGNVVEIYRPMIRDRVPDGDRGRPDVRNRPGEEQRVEERSRARIEARRKRAEANTDQGGRSQIEPPGGTRERTEVGTSTETRGRDQIESPGDQRQKTNVQAPAPGAKEGAKPETKPTPAPADVKADRERMEAERKALETRIREQRQELKKEQQKDIRTPPPGVSREEIERRHAEEQKAQEEIEKRDREQLQHREELQRQWREQREKEREQEKAREQQQRERQPQQQKDQQEKKQRER